MPEPSPSLSSVREKEVVVAPSESFPSGSGHVAGSEHWLCRWKITGKNWCTIFYQQTQSCMQLLLLSHFSKNVINVQNVYCSAFPNFFLKNGGPLEKVTFQNFQTNVFEQVISGSVLNLGGAGRSLMRPRLPSRVEPKSLQGAGRLYNFTPFWTKRTLSKSIVQTTKCTILWRLCVQSELKDEVLEPSSSLSSVREEEVVVVPSQGFPSGSENEAGSER